MTKREYREVYLRSEHWLAMRHWALERAEHRCQVCAAEDGLDVHHRTYERVGAERPADLTVLCRRCHDLFHAADTPRQRILARLDDCGCEAGYRGRDVVTARCPLCRQAMTVRFTDVDVALGCDGGCPERAIFDATLGASAACG